MSALSIATSNETPTMRPNLMILPATLEHVRELGETMREADRREIEIFGISYRQGLWRSYKQGMMNRTAIIDGKVAAMWGVGGSYMSDIGQPWLLTSHAIHKISPLRFAREYQREVYEMLKIFDKLENWVDNDYEGAIRLLSIVGFTIGEPEKMGNGIYRKFTLEGNV